MLQSLACVPVAARLSLHVKQRPKPGANSASMDISIMKKSLFQELSLFSKYRN
jgi:hypothetical protein